MNKEKIPVYVISGLLESGKTTFIKEKIRDASFSYNESIFLLVCEDGFIDYEDIEQEYNNVDYCFIDDINMLNKEYLDSLTHNKRYSMIIVEYNGMWYLDDLYNNLPLSWMIFQQILLIDSKTYNSYNVMFRNLLVDKIKNSEACIFNRYMNKYDKDFFHKSIRMITKKIKIYYEDLENNRVLDTLIDPLPFDINKEEITIELKDYAIWFQDLVEDPSKYNNKIITYIGKIEIDKNNNYLFGRKVMVCCEADIKFLGLIISNYQDYKFSIDKWYKTKGKIYIDNNTIFLYVLSSTKIESPNINEEVATFY